MVHRTGSHEAAGTCRAEVHGSTARDPGDRITGLEHRGGVRVEVVLPLFLRRVAPRDREDLLTLPDEVLDHAPVWRDVEHVVLVDRRWDEKQRDRAHGLRLRPILDEFEDSSAQHHAAGRGGEISADTEFARVDRGRKPRWARHIAGKIPQSVHQVGAATIDRFLEHGRVREREVRRRERVEQVRRRKPHLTLRTPVDSGIADQVVDGAADSEVTLHHPAEEPVAPPRIREPAIAARGSKLGPPRRHPAHLGGEIAHPPEHEPRALRETSRHLRDLARWKEVWSAGRGIGEHDLERRSGGSNPALWRRASRFWSRLTGTSGALEREHLRGAAIRRSLGSIARRPSARHYAPPADAFSATGAWISRLRILPVAPFGNSSTNQIWRGYLYAATRSLTNSRSSASVT